MKAKKTVPVIDGFDDSGVLTTKINNFVIEPEPYVVKIRDPIGNRQDKIRSALAIIFSIALIASFFISQIKIPEWIQASFVLILSYYFTKNNN